MGKIDDVNTWASESKVGEFFKLKERGTTLTTELRGGFTTFLTLAYILPINAAILSASGGPCECPEDNFGCRFGVGDGAQDYKDCVEEIRLQLIIVTALSAFFSCLMMGVTANLPFALAPGMGLNAYFTYDVVGFKGTGDIPWKTAMTAVFLEGIIFLLLTVTGLREKLTEAIPMTIKYAITGGIGLFLAIIGLTTAEGIGLVVNDIATGWTLGGCPPENRNPLIFCPSREMATQDFAKLQFEETIGIPPWFGDTTLPGFPVATCLSEPATSYTCDTYGGKLSSVTVWAGILCMILIGILLSRRARGAIAIGILVVTALSWIPDTSLSYFDDAVQPGGTQRFEYFKNVVYVKSIEDVAFQFDWSELGSGKLFLAVFTFLYVDILDTSGTLYAMASFAGIMDEETQQFPGSKEAFVTDSIATMLGAVLGTSTVTTYIESASGIEDGAKTGLASVFTSFFFLIALFFSPLIAAIPPWATGGALVVVGALMMKGLTRINWTDHSKAIPAFVTMIMMPFTYSIANGILFGLGFYILINGGNFLLDKIPFFAPTEEKEEKEEKDEKDENAP